jgi:hypothetical protein
VAGIFTPKAHFGSDATTAAEQRILTIDSVHGKSVTPVNLEPGQQANWIREASYPEA